MDSIQNALNSTSHFLYNTFSNTKTWFHNLPLTTKFYFFVNLIIFIIFKFSRNPIENWCNQPILFYDERGFHFVAVYRLVTSAFVHGGVLHILLNLFCFQSIGPYLERLLGSFLFFWLILLFAILGSLIEIALAFLVSSLQLFSTNFLAVCSVGFSGVLFSLIVLMSTYSLMPTASLFHIINVPMHIYPLVLLIFLSLLFSNMSFLGHLGGIIAGYCYTFGLLNFILPSTNFISKIESSVPFFSWLPTLSSYIPSKSSDSGPLQVLTTTATPTTVTVKPLQAIRGGRIETVDRNGENLLTTFQPFTGEGHRLGTETEKDSPV